MEHKMELLCPGHVLTQIQGVLPGPPLAVNSLGLPWLCSARASWIYAPAEYLLSPAVFEGSCFPISSPILVFS